MGLLLIGLVVVGLATGFIMSDMERKRRALSELVERLEPLVPRNRRLALHNLRRLSQSLFYAQNLMSQIERELLLLEKEKEKKAQLKQLGIAYAYKGFEAVLKL